MPLLAGLWVSSPEGLPGRRCVCTLIALGDQPDDPGDVNPADLFTKILSKQVFERHRRVVLNLAADTGMEHARRARVQLRDVSSQRDGTGAP